MYLVTGVFLIIWRLEGMGRFKEPAYTLYHQYCLSAASSQSPKTVLYLFSLMNLSLQPYCIQKTLPWTKELILIEITLEPT
jgi:hypothetical protein